MYLIVGEDVFVEERVGVWHHERIFYERKWCRFMRTAIFYFLLLQFSYLLFLRVNYWLQFLHFLLLQLHRCVQIIDFCLQLLLTVSVVLFVVSQRFYLFLECSDLRSYRLRLRLDEFILLLQTSVLVFQLFVFLLQSTDLLLALLPVPCEVVFELLLFLFEQVLEFFYFFLICVVDEAVAHCFADLGYFVHVFADLFAQQLLILLSCL